jgi:hypothetical protein
MMPSEELLQSWQRTRTHLTVAAALLPATSRANPEGGSLQDYAEFLEHNELKLALDELEGLAQVNAVTPAFWMALAKAAAEMKLSEHERRYCEAVQHAAAANGLLPPTSRVLDRCMREEHVSPDGKLRLLVVREAEDFTIGFDGHPWHTHGDVVAGELQLLGLPKCTPEDATKRLVADVLSGRIPIAVVRRGEQVLDVMATYLLEMVDPYRPDGETLEVRRWDGTSWESS